MRWWVRFLLEYVGNLEVAADRRRDAGARVLMDHIRDEMTREGVPGMERERRIARLRESVRAAGPEQAR